MAESAVALTDNAPERADPTFRALVEQLPAIVWVATLDGRTTYVSPQVERILGTPVETWIAWPRHIHPEDRDRVLAIMADCRRRDTKFRCEYRMLAADGRVVWVLDEAEVIRDAGGRPLAMQGVALDITERKQAETEAAARTRELETLHRISEIVRTGRPLDEIYAEITAEVQAVTGFSQVAIALHDESRGRLVYKGARGLPPGVDGADLETGLDQSLSGEVVRTGRPFAWRHGEPLPEPGARFLGGDLTRTYVGVPMSVGGRVIGALGMGDSTSHPVDPWLIQLAVSIADHVGGLIERARSREALAASERHFHAVFDGALDAMLVLDDTRTYVAANPAAGTMLGVPIAGIVGRQFGDFREAGLDVDTAWSAVREGRGRAGEWSFVRGDGTTRTLEYSITANFMPGRHLAVVRDVTERQQEEAARRVRATAVEAAASGIVITDAQGRIEWTNVAVTRMSGYTLAELRGLTPAVLKSGRHDPAFYRDLWTTILSGRVWRGSMSTAARTARCTSRT
jgi:PAS domain S-box-containing protein